MSAAEQSSNRARDGLARWQRKGAPDRYVPATTMCVSPRLPHRLRARREGFETTIRCGDCPGCREFEVLRLERRLVETYRAIAAAGDDNGCHDRAQVSAIPKKIAPRLSAVRIYCPAEMHASMSRRIHRWRGVEIEPGFFRAGVESFIVLSRDPAELVARLRRRRFRLDVRSVGPVKYLRSWRWIARGLLVARSAYGEDINRYYRRGLAAAEKEHFEVRKINEYKRFDRARDPRAVSERLGNLVPHEMLEVRRGFRLRMRNAFRFATTPEKVDSIMPEVLALVRRVAKPLVVSAVPKSADEIARNREFNIRMARNEPARTEDPIGSEIPSQVVGRVTEVLDNSGSFEERVKRRSEAMIRAGPTVEAWMAEEERRREAGERERTARSARKLDKELRERFASLEAKMREAEKNNGQTDLEQSSSRPRNTSR